MDRQAYFTRHENKVRFSMPGVLGYVWWFDRTHAFDGAAELEVRDFNKRLGDAMAKARREAYEQGWKDAKAHNTKRTWFTSVLMVNAD